MRALTINHQVIYRIGVIFFLVGFISILIAAVVIAQLRRSGSTGLDTQDVLRIRMEDTRPPVAESAPEQ